jgi:hypothetical protein
VSLTCYKVVNIHVIMFGGKYIYDDYDYDSASLCSLAGRYDNPIPTRFLAPIDCLKVQALSTETQFVQKIDRKSAKL